MGVWPWAGMALVHEAVVQVTGHACHVYTFTCMYHMYHMYHMCRMYHMYHMCHMYHMAHSSPCFAHVARPEQAGMRGPEDAGAAEADLPIVGELWGLYAGGEGGGS